MGVIGGRLVDAWIDGSAFAGLDKSYKGLGLRHRHNSKREVHR
jgi:hypothetical protein